MKITNIRPQQKELRLIIDTDNGSKIELCKFANELLCTNPPEKLNKENRNYIALKKQCLLSDYFTEDMHLKVRSIRHIKELKQRLKIFIGTNIS